MADLADPVHSIFEPQLELLKNENPDIRLAVVNSIISCDVQSAEITASIIQLLDDRSELVR